MITFFETNKNDDADQPSTLIAMDAAGNIKDRTIQPFATDFGGCEIELRMIPKGVYSGIPVPNADSADEIIHTFNASNSYAAIVTDAVSLEYDLYCNVTGGTGIDELNVNFS